MKLIVCLDESNGMSFGGRRQSRDRVVTEWICKIVGDSILWVEPSSASLFDHCGLKLKMLQSNINGVKRDEYFFVENRDVAAFFNKIDVVYVFWWNRAYPADLYFPVEQMDAEFTRIEQKVFEGFSHPEVTLEVFSR